MIDLLIDHIWISILLCILFTTAQHYLGLFEVYLYHNYATAYMDYEGRYDGYEWATSTDHRKWMPNTHLIIVLVVSSLAILAGWYALVKQVNQPEIFSFLLGGILLFRITRSLVNFRMISFFRFARNREDIQGKVTYSKRLAFTLPYLDMYGYALLYLLLFLFLGGWFLPGGVLTCFITARQNRDWVLVKT